MKTKVSTKGQIVRGEYRLVRRTARTNEGLVDWLLACPEKDFFVQIESESTDFEKAGVRLVDPFSGG